MSKDKYLKKLAVAFFTNPSGTTKELAEEAGISKATLHRYFGTRENLINIIEEQSMQFINNIKEVAEKPYEDFENGVKSLINAHYDGNEFLLYICGTHVYGESEWENYFKALDVFFLRGQKEGFFRIDVSVQALTEIFMTSVCAMIGAEKRGRVASSNMLETVEIIFLHGAKNKTK